MSNESRQSAQRTGYPYSPDGINWSKHPNNPVLSMGASGSWDDYMLILMATIYKDNQFEMWYSAGDGDDSDHGNFRIGYASSSDGFTWTKYTNNPVLNLDEPGAWDNENVATSSVIFDSDDNIYKMWYGAGYATSAPSTHVSTQTDQKPNGYTLSQNYPNPFNLKTAVNFSLAHRANVRITIYDINGRLVETLCDCQFEKGVHSVNWDASETASGIYTIVMKTDEFFAVKKCVLIK